MHPAVGLDPIVPHQAGQVRHTIRRYSEPRCWMSPHTAGHVRRVGGTSNIRTVRRKKRALKAPRPSCWEHYFLLPAAYCLLPTAYCLLSTIAYCLPDTAYQVLRTACCLLPTYYLSTACCLLPTYYLSTACCLLPTLYCLLSTAYHHYGE